MPLGSFAEVFEYCVQSLQTVSASFRMHHPQHVVPSEMPILTLALAYIIFVANTSSAVPRNLNHVVSSLILVGHYILRIKL